MSTDAWQPDFIVGDPSSNSDEWTAEYVRRAGEVMDTVLDSGAKLVWVGIPNDNNPEVTAETAAEWTAGAEGKSFMRLSADAWAEVHIATGDDPAAAKAAADTTYAMYTGQTPRS